MGTLPDKRVLWLLGAGLGLFGALLLGALRSQPASPPPETPGPPEQPGEIGVRWLIEEMVDLRRVAALADPPYTAHLASSYDRRSTSADDQESWFANDDWASAARPNYVALEENSGRREYVLLDAKGPGAVVRIWTATPTGTLRIYLDGATDPVLEEPLGQLLSGYGTIPPP